jgi:hypothetical protein
LSCPEFCLNFALVCCCLDVHEYGCIIVMIVCMLCWDFNCLNDAWMHAAIADPSVAWNLGIYSPIGRVLLHWNPTNHLIWFLRSKRCSLNKWCTYLLLCHCWLPCLTTSSCHLFILHPIISSSSTINFSFLFHPKIMKFFPSWSQLSLVFYDEF